MSSGSARGRVAIPLAARGVEVTGIDLSVDMLAELRAKPEAATIAAVEGDMAQARIAGEFSLVYLVFNTFRSRHLQRSRDGVFRGFSAPFRFVWPSELDLMARIARMRLEHRWAGWDRAPFLGESTSAVSVWRSER